MKRIITISCIAVIIGAALWWWLRPTDRWALIRDSADYSLYFDKATYLKDVDGDIMVTLRYDQKGEPRVLANNVRMNTAIASFIVRCDTRTAEPHQVVIALRTPGKPSAAVAEFRDQKAIAALSENNSVAFGDTALKLACH